MSFDLHPMILFAWLSALAAVVLICFACRTRNGLLMSMLVLLAVLFILPSVYLMLAFYPEFTDARFRTYKGFYRDIRMGMTRQEVFDALERRYPTNGLRQRPKIMRDEPGGLGFFMNPETSQEPNCEGIFLALQAGRVTQKSYSPD